MALATKRISNFFCFYSHLRNVNCVKYKSSEAEQRWRIFNEIRSSTNTSSTLKVLTNGAHGLSKSVVIKINGSNILFNCGEAVDRTLKGNVKAVFATHLDWCRIGGLPSLCHKLNKRNLGEVPMYAPEGLDVFLYGAEKFLPTHDFKVNIGKSEKIILENLLEVVCVPITNRKMKYVEPCPIDKSWRVRNVQKFERRGSILKRPPSNKVALDTCFAFICKAESSKLWVLSECVKRGVKPGPDMHRLWNGEEITQDDGTRIRPSDVIKVATHSAVIVADCPTEDYLDDLLVKKEFDDFSKSKYPSPLIIVHFTPFSVMMDQRYINWMESFHEDTMHLVVNDSNEWNGREKVINRHEICKLISRRFFPDLSHSVELRNKECQINWEISNSNDYDELAEKSYDCAIKEIPTESWLQKWKNLPDKLRLFQSWCGTIVNLKNQKIFRESKPFGISNMQSLLECSPSLFEDPREADCYNRIAATKLYPKVTFLGTSSQGSSAYRNSSGILLHLSHDKAMLLDCGDGILHQLATMYNSSQLQDVLTSLKCIYLSHPHADHHAGIISVLLEMKKARKASGKPEQKVVLLAPAPLIEWLELYHNKFEPVLEDIIMIVISDLFRGGPELTKKINVLVREVLDLKRILVCRARHCPFSHCVSFEHTDGWKISYSGDTMISDDFMRIGFNSDLLIHEATYASNLEDAARKNAHCTTAEAIEVGRRMEAKHIILTHFSRRYPVIPYLQDLKNTSNVSIAFDFLQVSLSDLHLLPRLNDIYKVVFAEYESENEEAIKTGTKQLLLEEVDEDYERAHCNDK